MRTSRLKLPMALVAGFLVLTTVAPPASAVFDEPKKGGEQADAPPATPGAAAALEAGLAAAWRGGCAGGRARRGEGG